MLLHSLFGHFSLLPRRKVQNFLSAAGDWTFILFFRAGMSRIPSRRRWIGHLSCFFMLECPEFPHVSGVVGPRSCFFMTECPEFPHSGEVVGHLSCFFMTKCPFSCFFARFLDIFPCFLRRKVQNFLTAAADWTYLLLFHDEMSRISSRQRCDKHLLICHDRKRPAYFCSQ